MYAVQEAMAAARLEEDVQVEEWGAVEAGHDLDEADIGTRIAAPSVFLRLLALKDVALDTSLCKR
jgi:ATP synthase F1 complex assembly factor 2